MRRSRKPLEPNDNNLGRQSWNAIRESYLEAPQGVIFRRGVVLEWTRAASSVRIRTLMTGPGRDQIHVRFNRGQCPLRSSDGGPHERSQWVTLPRERKPTT